VRSNPGYILLKEGQIAGKWSWATLPAKELFVNSMQAKEVQRMNKKSPALIVYSISLSVILLVLLISSFFKRDKGESEI
jgi:hypothetical protein